MVGILWLYCVVDAIGAPAERVRNLQKPAWVVIVLLFPFVGSIAWLVAGRPETGPPLRREQGGAPGFPEYERPGRAAAVDPAKDEEFLRQVRARAEEQRRRYAAERAEADQPKQDPGSGPDGD